ncbi:MAG: hypothetical protein O2931_05860 [Planctomycetota bacterium]|nr:hypothetical protein [Planctomycetota bacterium]MDA1178309.1 hypothetical protein [Planctomycetota bacterium]
MLDVLIKTFANATNDTAIVRVVSIAAALLLAPFTFPVANAEVIAHSEQVNTAAVTCQDAPGGAGQSHPGDSIWLVNTRHIAEDCRRGSPHYQLWQCGCWRNSSRADFATHSSHRTCIFVHGNRIESHEAPQLGLDLYRRLSCLRTCREPTRFVIWSWPSDGIFGPLRDARAKAKLATCESFHLGRFLQSMPSDEPTSLIGFSYGAQVILSSTHLLGGGCLQCRRLAPTDHPSVRPQVVLAASAVDSGWLQPGGSLATALVPIARLTLVSNTNDPVLRRFHIATGRPDSVALGVTGLNPRISPTILNQCDFGDDLQRSHSWERHIRSACVLRFMQQGAELR